MPSAAPQDLAHHAANNEATTRLPTASGKSSVALGSLAAVAALAARRPVGLTITQVER